MEPLKKIDSRIDTMRWASRLIGFIPCAIIAMFYIIGFVEAQENEHNATTTVASVLFLIIIGSYLLTYISELIGGIMLGLSGTAMLVFLIWLSMAEDVGSNMNTILLYALPTIVSGVLAILCWIYSQARKENLKMKSNDNSLSA